MANLYRLLLASSWPITPLLSGGFVGVVINLPNHRAQYYGRTSYWDERYTKDPEPFDWYQRYCGIRDLITQYVKKSDSILMAGCGNSRLSEEMYDDGFLNINNVDISRVVIDQMVERYKEKSSMTWQQMNVCSLDFPDESFDVVLDKGTMDSILCGEGSTANVHKFCTEVSRVLKPKGVFLVISYGIPDNRLQYMQDDNYSWITSVHTVPKPTVSAAAATPDVRDANSMHYFYVCAKGDGHDGEENVVGGKSSLKPMDRRTLPEPAKA